MTSLDHAAVTQAIGTSMRSFEAAERALDAERLLEHFANVPEFHMHSDGERLSYHAMASGVRAAFPTLRSIEGGFTDLAIIVLGPTAALASASFQETVIDGTGGEHRRRGVASWLWRHDTERWHIVYGHVAHYPVSA